MSFLGNLFKKHAENAVTSVQQFLVTLDPETATEAQIAEFSDQLRKASEELAKARADYQKEEKQAEEIEALYQKRLQAAGILEQQLSDTADSVQKASVSSSLEKIVTMLEQMKPDVERERKDAEDAKQLMDELTGFVEDSAQALKTARARLDHAKSDMRRAEIEQERAEKRAKTAEVLAGIKQEAGTSTWPSTPCRKKRNRAG